MNEEEMLRRIRLDLEDGYDEELEMEIDDRSIRGETSPADESADRKDRRFYFRELFRLQAELIKLQDWVATTQQKVVILFEGRDAAGKGGAIKRITQRLNPRVCRTV